MVEIATTLLCFYNNFPMTNYDYFLIDIVNFSCADCVRFIPIETQRLETEIHVNNNVIKILEK